MPLKNTIPDPVAPARRGSRFGAFDGALFGRACPTKARSNTVQMLHPLDNTHVPRLDALELLLANFRTEVVLDATRDRAGFRP